MESKLVEALGLKDVKPVALLWSEEEPSDALMFKPGKWGCVMWLVASASRGRVAAVSRETVGCYGGAVGLGFGNAYEKFPGGREGFCYFLSVGNLARPGGEALGERVRPHMTPDSYEHFLHGERYKKRPELVEAFIASLPIMEIPARFVVFKPLERVVPEDRPKTVIFFLRPDELSALVVLANYAREGNENVIIPFGAGCQTIGIYPYREGERHPPRGVVGLTDISARLFTKKQMGEANFLTFAVPWEMYLELEDHVGGSFLERPTWRQLKISVEG
ncbi:MAG: DUF169 domain-containing protein [Syntrophales bacterium]|nr:DUF169 domain-containing protein [Syntrophales bacterium]